MKPIAILILLLLPCRAHSQNNPINNSIDMELVLIPAGSFTMGSAYEDDMRQNDEKPHLVTIERPFYMSATEVTQAQWTAVMGHNKSFHNGDSLPAEKMSWKEAVAFCEKLSELEEKTYRLPTEAEWEYACRAGEESPAMDQLGERAWCAMNSSGRTQPVEHKQPNAWGLYDMLGNVSEWCADGYVADYAAHAEEAQARTKVIRGGAYDSFPPACRPAARTSGPTAYKYTQTGFRVVMEISE